MKSSMIEVYSAQNSFNAFHINILSGHSTVIMQIAVCQIAKAKLVSFISYFKFQIQEIMIHEDSFTKFSKKYAMNKLGI